MSFDLHLAPPSGFLAWNNEQWDEFFFANPETYELGRSLYVALVIECIAHNLEDDAPGSEFPLLMRIHHDEAVGWYQHEVGSLLREVREVKKRLTALPIDRSTLNYDNEADVHRRIRDFKDYYPTRPLDSLYDLNFHFLDGFETMATKALASGQGLFVSY